MSNAQFDLTVNYRAMAGDLLWVGVVLSSTSGRIAGINLSSQPALVAAGCFAEASALPLPSTATPVAVTSAWIHLPLICFQIA